MPKVLVADDSLTVRKVVERALVPRSIQVLAAATAREAMEQIEREEPDLVICDVLMPDTEGYEVCEFVKTHARLSRIPVLLISGIVNSAVLERAARVHSDDVMRKPFAAEELVRKVDALLGLAGNGGPAAGRVGREGGEGGALYLPGLAQRAAPACEGAGGPGSDLRACLGQLAALPGIWLAVLADREGFVVECAGEGEARPEIGWALAACVSEVSEGIARELGQGALQAMILELEGGVLFLQSLGAAAVLALVLRDATVLGKARYSVRRALPDLLRAL